MCIRSLESLFAVVAAIGSTIGFSQEALAMNMGDKLSADQIQANLVKETQHVVAVADEVVIQDPKAQNIAVPRAPSGLLLDALFFTMDDNGKGYCIRTNARSDQKFTEGVIVGTFTRMAIYDARKRGVDPRTTIDGDRAAVEAKCKNTGAHCFYHNDALKAFDQNNSGVMLQASGDFMTTEGIEVEGVITVLGDISMKRTPEDKDFNGPQGRKMDPQGILGCSSSDGLFVVVGPLATVSYGPYALQRLGNPGQ